MVKLYKKILLGMDKSDDAFHAAKKAIEFQKMENCTVVAFHSVLHHLSEMNPNPFSPTGVSVGISYSLHNDYIKRGEYILSEVEKLFKESNEEVETRLIFDIPPEDYVKKMVDEEGFDLIILGCKGHHSKLSRVFLGTVPIKVINNVSSDVLIVR